MLPVKSRRSIFKVQTVTKMFMYSSVKWTVQQPWQYALIAKLIHKYLSIEFYDKLFQFYV